MRDGYAAADGTSQAGPDLGCAVLDWAASGAMALTGLPGGPSVATPAPALTLLRAVTGQLARVTRDAGHEVRVNAAGLLADRAALAGFTRGGQVSAGGSSFLMRAADGWCAVTLARADDLAAVPAVIGALGLDPPERAEPGAPGGADALAAAARSCPAADFAAAGQLLGVPTAALPARPAPSTPADPPSAADWPPWQTTRIAPPRSGARLDGAVVVDLSSMWAGPLCARLLGLAGTDVIKVESPHRPDGARSGNREFFDWLHAGHRSVTVDFGTRAGRATLAGLLRAADVVIEASRPRALAALGLAPGMIPHRDGQVWLSITGYGQRSPDLVAFGDDAAVAGGLVGWTGCGSAAAPVFCADALADPLTGVCGALAVARSRAAGGGEQIDLPMQDVAAAFAAAAHPGHGRHEIRADSVRCPHLGRIQAIVPPCRPGPPAGTAPHAAPLGADTGAVLAWLAGRCAC
jgi:hypothetical protein